jgi:CubicO group peptidase (beta-lactamase class C family)
MRSIFRSVALLVAVMLAAPPIAFAASTPGPVAAIDAYLRSLVPYGFAGNVVIARDGKPLLAAGYGLADREKALPLTAGTPISIGSITKQFTAAAILKLQEQGKLKIDDSIGRYLPMVPNDKAAITIKELLTHTAGLQSDYGSSDDEKVGRADYLARVMKAPLQAAPGAQFEYSNAGYSLLAAIVVLVSHESYEKYLHDDLFVPAGMLDTGYGLQRAGRPAIGYRDDKRWGTISGRDYPDGEPYWNLLGNGGIQSTPADMLRWDRALDTGRVLRKASVDALQTGYVSEGQGGGPASQYGFGWSIVQTPHGKLVTHNGGNGVFAADFLRYVDDGVTIYIASTGSGVPATMLSRVIARMYYGDAVVAPAPAVTTLSATQLQANAGTYATAGGATVTFAVENGALVGRTADPALFATLQPIKPLPQQLHDDVTPRAQKLLAQAPSATPSSDDPWSDFLARNGKLDDAKIIAYTALEQDIGVWVSAMQNGKPVYLRMRFGPEHMVGLVVSESPPSVAFLPQSATGFIAYYVPGRWSSTVAFSGSGADLTGQDGTVTHLTRGNVAAVGAPTDTQRLASVEPNVTLASLAVTLPMQVDRFKPVIDVMIDGKGPFHFGVETGGPFIGIRQKVLDGLGLKPVMPGAPPLYQIDAIDAGGFHVGNARAIATEAADPSIDGILGLNTFASLLMTIDYPGRQLVLSRGALPAPNGRDVLATVPIAFGFGVHLDIGGVGSDAFIDTRSETALGVSPSLADGIHFAYAPVTVGMARGAGFAPIPVKAARLAGNVMLGEYSIAQPIVDVRQLPPYLPSQPLLGGRILSQFAVTLDQRNGRVRFVLPGGGTTLPAPPPTPWEKPSQPVGTR